MATIHCRCITGVLLPLRRSNIACLQHFRSTLKPSAAAAAVCSPLSHSVSSGNSCSSVSSGNSCRSRRALHYSSVHLSSDVWPMGTAGIIKSNNKHLVITADSSREELVSKGTVTRIWQETEEVKGFNIAVHDPQFGFKAGQWVDTMIPGVDTVGGFSLCSPPHLLPHTITLAIKSAQWPPALWFHTKCCVGSVIHLRVGGDFYLDVSRDTGGAAATTDSSVVTEDDAAATTSSTTDSLAVNTTGSSAVNGGVNGITSSCKSVEDDYKNRTNNNNNNSVNNGDYNNHINSSNNINSDTNTTDTPTHNTPPLTLGSSSTTASLQPPLLLLVGGGVGVNPLASMFRHVAYQIQQQQQKQNQQQQDVLPRVSLIYSAKNTKDLLFKKELDLATEVDSELLTVQYLLTRLRPADTADNCTFGRISKATLSAALRGLCRDADVSVSCGGGSGSSSGSSSSGIGITSTGGDSGSVSDGGGGDGTGSFDINSGDSSTTTSKIGGGGGVSIGASATTALGRVHAYVCGPPGMIEEVESVLVELGLGRQQVHYEKWW